MQLVWGNADHHPEEPRRGAAALVNGQGKLLLLCSVFISWFIRSPAGESAHRPTACPRLLLLLLLLFQCVVSLDWFKKAHLGISKFFVRTINYVFCDQPTMVCSVALYTWHCYGAPSLRTPQFITSMGLLALWNKRIKSHWSRPLSLFTA